MAILTLRSSISRQSKVAVLVALIAATVAGPAIAASLTQQKTQIKRVGTYLRSAERLAKAERLEDAAEAFARAQSSLSEVAKEGLEPKLQKSFDRAKQGLEEAHAKLAEAGVKVGELESIEAKMASSEADLGRGESKGRFDPRNVSFVRDVAPMLAAKCGSCHIDGKRGGFSLATYRDLMNGTEGVGRVLVPGDGATSHIVELIASGDMPRGGGRVTPQETQKLVAWITQGAKFDGASETTNLRSLKAGGGEPAKEEEKKPAAMQVARPTGNETVSFATDVAPILTSRCAECHGAGNPRAGLSVLDFRRLMRGGDSGAVVKAKDVAGSLLIHRIDGSEPPRMPLRRTALSSKEIAAISTWIREGATFDGEDIDTPLTRVTQLARAERATSEELSAMREEAARRNWRLALPDETAETAATEHFLVMGNLPAARLSAIGEEAERLLVEVHDVYGESGEEPFGKGRITVFALAKRIDYSEFRLMVHRSQAPREERGANAYDLVDAYVAVQLGLTSDPRDAAALAQQIAAVYLADYTRNGLPDWLVDGAARVAAARVAPKAEVVADWDASLEDAVAGLKRPADIFGNKLSPSTTGVLRYGFVEGLMRKPRSLRSVLQQAASGDKELEAAFKREYRYTPEELAPLWVNSQRRRR